MWRPRVLLVDDESQLRAMLRLVLEAKGYDVVAEAADGAEGVAAAALLSPDVVVMDLSMPKLNGIDATQQIKAAQPAVPVVFYSAYVDESLRAAAFESGAADWVVKGTRSHEIVAALDRATGRSAPT